MRTQSVTQMSSIQVCTVLTDLIFLLLMYISLMGFQSSRAGKFFVASITREESSFVFGHVSFVSTFHCKPSLALVAPVTVVTSVALIVLPQPRSPAEALVADRTVELAGQRIAHRVQLALFRTCTLRLASTSINLCFISALQRFRTVWASLL